MIRTRVDNIARLEMIFVFRWQSGYSKPEKNAKIFLTSALDNVSIYKDMSIETGRL